MNQPLSIEETCEVRNVEAARQRCVDVQTWADANLTHEQYKVFEKLGNLMVEEAADMDGCADAFAVAKMATMVKFELGDFAPGAKVVSNVIARPESRAMPIALTPSDRQELRGWLPKKVRSNSRDWFSVIQAAIDAHYSKDSFSFRDNKNWKAWCEGAKRGYWAALRDAVDQGVITLDSNKLTLLRKLFAEGAELGEKMIKRDKIKGITQPKIEAKAPRVMPSRRDRKDERAFSAR